MQALLDQVLNPARLAALRAAGLLDSPAEKVFDELGEVAAQLLQTPVALVTLVDAHRQFFKSCRGLPEPWASWRETPLTHSFCKHVVHTGAPLVINDAREDPRVSDNLAIHDINVIAYLGIPLLLSSGYVLGTFCVIDHKPRHWSEHDIRTLRILADCVIRELELRSALKLKEDAITQFRQVNEALQAFSYSVAHDLKGPLRAMSAFGNLLVREAGDCLSPNGRQYLEIMLDGSRKMGELIDGLMALTKAGKSELQLEEVDISRMAQAQFDELRASDPRREVEFRVEPGLTAQADRVLLRQVLQNLLGNAWKFTTNRTHATIEVGRHQTEGPSSFFVRDNGVGFPPEMAEQLFTPFKRLHGREFAGTGIGLAIVKQVIERHGGKVCAEAALDQGATFYFTLPSPRSEAPAEQCVLAVTEKST